MTTLHFGDRAAQLVSERVAAPCATLSALKDNNPRSRSNGQLAVVLADGSVWRFVEASTLTGDDVLIVTPTDAPSAGRWVRAPGAAKLVLPITYATADATALLTLQAGTVLNLRELFWTITTSFTGGSSSAIGVSSNKTGFSTKGDLLGGASGNVLADLTTTLSPTVGTIGAGFDTLAKRRALWVATNTIRFDKITSSFTAGVGAVNCIVDILQNDGA